MKWGRRCFGLVVGQTVLLILFCFLSRTIISARDSTSALTVSSAYSMGVSSIFLCFLKGIIVDIGMNFLLFVRSV